MPEEETENEDIYKNPMEFRKSIGRELIATKNRIRNLIGRNHWLEDGLYKEAILKKVLRNLLPKNVTIGTGFILKTVEDELIPSSQIDIILHSNAFPTVFQEGDFIITTPLAVIGIIEVKTTISCTGESGFESIIQKASDNTSYLQLHNSFNALFSFETDITRDFWRTIPELSVVSKNVRANYIISVLETISLLEKKGIRISFMN